MKVNLVYAFEDFEGSESKGWVETAKVIDMADRGRTLGEYISSILLIGGVVREVVRIPVA